MNVSSSFLTTPCSSRSRRNTSKKVAAMIKQTLNG
jgi:hypothetical protein